VTVVYSFILSSSLTVYLSSKTILLVNFNGLPCFVYVLPSGIIMGSLCKSVIPAKYDLRPDVKDCVNSAVGDDICDGRRV
jgi:hypothetical protein